jgi:hypothetical protein
MPQSTLHLYVRQGSFSRYDTIYIDPYMKEQYDSPLIHIATIVAREFRVVQRLLESVLLVPFLCMFGSRHFCRDKTGLV